MYAMNIGIFFLLFSTALNAQDFKAVYSCSTGNENKPITYAFNSKYMLRDSEAETPFEFIANFKDGEYMYVGYVKGENFKFADEIYGFTENNMKKWSLTFTSGLNFNDPVETKHEYILRKSLNCALEPNLHELLRSNNNVNYQLINQNDKSEVDFNFAKTCETSKKYVEKVGISNIVDYFKKTNFNKILRYDGAIRKSVVVINVKKNEIWESWVGSKTTSKLFKCSAISVDVPKILPPKEKMFIDLI
jgi:hypothetical protein